MHVFVRSACRLSFAALQALPEASREDRAAALAVATAAMTTQDVDVRLQRALLALREARTSLQAKLALKTVLS